MDKREEEMRRRLPEMIDEIRRTEPEVEPEPLVSDEEAAWLLAEMSHSIDETAKKIAAFRAKSFAAQSRTA